MKEYIDALSAYEHCIENWTPEDMRIAVEAPFDPEYLTENGWSVDECGNAQKSGVLISNSGVVSLPSGYSFRIGESIDTLDITDLGLEVIEILDTI